MQKFFNIQITVNSYAETENNSMDETEKVPTSEGTPSNPILLDDEPDVQMDKHYWQNQEHGPQG